MRWSSLKDPGSDLCLKTKAGYWDVVYGVDGWVIYTPADSCGDRKRIVLGSVTRDVAQAEAEKLILARRSLRSES